MRALGDGLRAVWLYALLVDGGVLVASLLQPLLVGLPRLPGEPFLPHYAEVARWTLVFAVYPLGLMLLLAGLLTVILVRGVQSLGLSLGAARVAGGVLGALAALAALVGAAWFVSAFGVPAGVLLGAVAGARVAPRRPSILAPAG